MSNHHPSHVRRLVELYLAVWNSGRIEELEALVAEDFVRTADPLSESVTGREALARLIGKTRLDMPDFAATAEEVLVEDDRAAVRWRMTGTDTGPGDLPPTGRPLSVAGLSFFELRGDVLSREWTIIDGLAALGQMGYTMRPLEPS